MRCAVRLETRQVRERDYPYTGESLLLVKRVVNFARSLENSDIEKFIALCLDSQGVLNCIMVQPGTIKQATVFPREIIKHCILSNSCAVVLVHNHPSGNTLPSTADVKLTKTISEACKIMDITLHDHVIVATGRYYSFCENGML